MTFLKNSLNLATSFTVVTSLFVSGPSYGQSASQKAAAERAKKFNESRKASAVKTTTDPAKTKLQSEYQEISKKGSAFAGGFFQKSDNKIIILMHLGQDCTTCYGSGYGVFEYQGTGIGKSLLLLNPKIYETYKDYSAANVANNNIVQKVNIDYYVSWKKACSDDIYRMHTINSSDDGQSVTPWMNIRCNKNSYEAYAKSPNIELLVFRLAVTTAADGKKNVSVVIGNGESSYTPANIFNFGISSSADYNNENLFKKSTMEQNPIYKNIKNNNNVDVLDGAKWLIGKYIVDQNVIAPLMIQTGALDCGDIQQFRSANCSIPFLHKPFVEAQKRQGTSSPSEDRGQSAEQQTVASNASLPPVQYSGKGYLGIAFSDVTPDIAQGLNMRSVVGALIGSVGSGSPADQAGLRPGDVIYQINGQTIIPSMGVSLAQAIATFDAGTTVQLGIVRQGAGAITVNVVLGNRP